MEQQQGVGGVLRDRAQRSAFFNLYRDEVYALALDLTHDSYKAVNLVRDVFNEAFKKFADSPCPADSQPYLYATTFLVFSRGPSDDTKNNVTDPVFAPQYGAQPRQTADPRALPPYGPNAGAYPARGAQPSYGGYAEGPAQGAQSGYVPPYGARSGGYQQAYAQQQAYARQPYGNQAPPYGQQAPYGPQYQPGYTQPSAAPAFTYSAPVTTPAGPAVPPVENPYAPASGAKPFEPLRDIDQKVEAPTGPYIGKTGKRRRRSTVLFVLNTLLFFVLAWVLLGLVMRLELIPAFDLGYEWFNETLFPLF